MESHADALLLPTRIYAFAAAVLVSIGVNGCGNTSATSPAAQLRSTVALRQRVHPRRPATRYPSASFMSDPRTTTATTRPTPTGPPPSQNGRRQGHGGGDSRRDGRRAKNHGEHDPARRRQLIFPTSFGYFDPHVLVMAKKYPDVMFLHCGGLWNEKVHPKNVGSYFGYIDECQYLSGIVAGHTTKSKKLGFVAAKPIPQVRRNINAFELGARSVDPKITCTVIFTGDWSMPVKEAEATNSLIDQGVDVVTCHVDSPKVVVENAEKPRHLHLRLPLQPGDARPQGLSHRGRVELGEGLHRLHQDVQSAPEDPEPGPRRLEGTDRQDVALRAGRQR